MMDKAEAAFAMMTVVAELYKRLPNNRYLGSMESSNGEPVIMITPTEIRDTVGEMIERIYA